MSLLSRAIQAREGQQSHRSTHGRSWDERTSAEVARGLNHRLQFDPPVEAEELTKLSDGWERTLWGIEREGLAFIAGYFWHGNPGDSFYVAAKRGKLPKRRRFPWPPTNSGGGPPVALCAETWAPRGFKPIPHLAVLAELA